MLWISMSSLLHSVMTFGKKEFLKYSVLHIKDGTFISSIIKTINWWKRMVWQEKGTPWEAKKITIRTWKGTLNRNTVD